MPALDRKRNSIHRAHDAGIAAEKAALGLEVLAEPRCLEDDRHAAPLRTKRLVLMTSGAASQQRAVRPSRKNSCGASSRQRSKARGHRGAKEHPGGSAAKSGGWPSIAVRRCALSLIRGIELSSASV